jgi:Uma2 family endonuclease
MSSLAQSLVTLAEFLQLPERPENWKRYELHDGEIVSAPPARPLHIKLQKRIERLLEALAGERGVVTIEFPYRPALNLQYWYADVAYVPRAHWEALPPDEYPVYAPALIVEVLSPSNDPAKLDRQRIMAMSAGTQEFWVVDPEKLIVEVSHLRGTKSYRAGELIVSTVLEGTVAVDQIFGLQE